MPIHGIFQLNGLEQYLENIQRAGNDVDVAASEAVDAGAEIVFEDVQANAPVLKKDDPRRVKGQLKSDVYRTEVQHDGDYHFVVVGVDEKKDLPYETFVEYGTSDTAAQPFFRPGFDNNRNKVHAAEREILKDKGLVE